MPRSFDSACWDLVTSFIDDQAPHLNMSVTERKWRSCTEIPVAEIEAAVRDATTGKSRSEGAQKAAATRAKNTARRISRRGIVTGSTKQKQWAAEIRAKAVGGGISEFARDVLSGERETGAKLWIDNRNGISSAIASLERAYAQLVDAHAAIADIASDVILTNEHRDAFRLYEAARGKYRAAAAI